MSQDKQHQAISQSFHEILEAALKKIDAPNWLEKNSVLASPYYLGEELTRKENRSKPRGEVLKDLILKAIAQIHGEEEKSKRYQTVLRMRYVEKSSAKDIQKKLAVEESQYYKILQEARSELAKTLISIINQSLQLDFPPLCENLLGRQAELRLVAKYVDAGQHLSVSGADGSGKTALIAHFLQDTERPILWFTVRPGLNDSIASFAFDLGLFCHQHGESALRFGLIDNQGQLEIAQLVSLMNYAISKLTAPPVICIDNVDKLHPSANPEHSALVHLWESLRGQALFMFIGQRMLINTEEHLFVKGLSIKATKDLFADYDVELPDDEIKKYHDWTQGNVRLLKLCCSVLSLSQEELEVGKSFSTLIIELLISRVWMTLSEDEQVLMQKLSVYRRPVFFGYLDDQMQVITFQTLESKQIIDIRNSGVVLKSDYLHYIYNNLSPEKRRFLHREAAEVRIASEAYSSAIYHLIQSDKFVEAMELWDSHKEQEFAKGQVLNIIKLFRESLQKDSLSLGVKEWMLRICADLERFLGNTKAALADIQGISTTFPMIYAEAKCTQGEIENEHDPDAAQKTFEQALQEASTLLEIRIAQIYKGLAWAHWRQKDLVQAGNVLDYAQIEIDNMRGNIAIAQCKYEEALSYYAQTLLLARKINALHIIAKILINISIIHTLRGEFEESLVQLQESYQLYEEVHQVGSMVGCRITTAVVYNMMHQYRDAEKCLAQAEEFLTEAAIVTPRLTAVFHQAKSETLLGLGHYDEAMGHIQQVIAIDDKSVLPDAYRTYGEILMCQEKWQEAEDHLIRSLKLAEENGDKFLLAYSYRALGKFYQKQSQIDAGRNALEKAIELFESIYLSNEAEICRQLLKKL